MWFTGFKRGTGPVEQRFDSPTRCSQTRMQTCSCWPTRTTRASTRHIRWSTDAPKYARRYVQAIKAAGYSTEVWDVDAQGVPHDLGVLSHYDAVVWYLGDNRITQDPEDELISTPFGQLPDIGVAERQQFLTMAVRDYLNEGGKLVHAGETAQHSGLPGIGDVVGGLFYGLNGDPTAECVVQTVPGFFEDCLILADDFSQYYLGALHPHRHADPFGVSGIADPLAGLHRPSSVDRSSRATTRSTRRESSSRPATSLPAGRVPAVRERRLAAVRGRRPAPPSLLSKAARYAGALHQDSSYMRLTKTVDLSSGVDQRELALPDLDQHRAVVRQRDRRGAPRRARRAGRPWRTSTVRPGTDPPAECEPDGFLLQLHPFLSHYLAGPGCTEPGSSGEWNAFTGSTGGWHQAAFDLSGCSVPATGRTLRAQPESRGWRWPPRAATR